QYRAAFPLTCPAVTARTSTSRSAMDVIGAATASSISSAFTHGSRALTIASAKQAARVHMACLPVRMTAQNQVDQPGERVRHHEVPAMRVPLDEWSGDRTKLTRRIVAHQHLEQQLEEHAHAADRRQQQEGGISGVARCDHAADRAENRTLEELEPRKALDGAVLVSAGDRLGCADP